MTSRMMIAMELLHLATAPDNDMSGPSAEIVLLRSFIDALFDTPADQVEVATIEVCHVDVATLPRICNPCLYARCSSKNA